MVLIITAVVIVVIQRRKMRRLIDDLTDMIDSAAKGEFKEKAYDESLYSMLESKLGDYLRSSELSADRVKEEKDTIKSLISDISHQTKTPIANLMLHSELLEEKEGLAPDVREAVGSIHSQAEKLQFLIDSLVKMSRLENGIFKFDPVPYEADELMADTVSSLKEKAKDKGLELKMIPTDVVLECDPKWTREVLINITDNAIKYTKSGSVTLSAEKYDIYAYLSVKDTGNGISEDERTKIFQRFYRGESSRGSEGVGVGLYLAREIITGQSGYIKVISEPGEGAEFRIFLPASNLSKPS